MEITGKIIAVLPEQGGVSKNGNEWKSRNTYWKRMISIPRKFVSSCLVQTVLLKPLSSQGKN